MLYDKNVSSTNFIQLGEIGAGMRGVRSILFFLSKL